jgi:mRNA-degrading endonuclease RelE of RelBE toxin-antitoxin system
MPNEGSSGHIRVEFTPEFKRNIRHLSKKYRHIKSDVHPAIEELALGRMPGGQIQSVGYRVYKIRVKNTDIKKGKRSGYRIIYHVQTETKIVLITIYSKTEQGDISAEKIRRIISEFESKPE